MDPASRLFHLRQGNRPVEDYVIDFCELCYLVTFNDVALKDIFRVGLNDPICSCLPGGKIHWSLEQYIDYALRLSGSSFTVGIADEELCNPTVPITSKYFYTPTIMSGIVNIMPEPSYAMPAKPAQDMSTKPQPFHVMPAKPQPAHAMPAAPGPAHAMATLPESAPVMATLPDQFTRWLPSLGPDNIPGRVLRDLVPTCLKSTSIIPVRKKSPVSRLNDYHPIALTPIMMKCFERLVMHHIKSSLPNTLDPFQFTYRPNHSTDDAMPSTLHLALTDLEQKDSYVRMLFIDFSSAFNTIIAQQLIHKLNLLGLNTSLCNWILDFLTGRPQRISPGPPTSCRLATRANSASTFSAG
ncbi:hypothetical protein M9458_056887 [Cirrhinus mrigala]|uniref:Reverse transcriptase domain-containing protein n=1 Tax=Cirrhinus mrigala TaxID=683832 RepID=A0ABD0MFU4_CIRMR